jgi:hypothetical protein
MKIDNEVGHYLYGKSRWTFKRGSMKLDIIQAGKVEDIIKIDKVGGH